MTHKPFTPDKTEPILKNIREGMEVLDSKGDKIGTVKRLYFGADSDEMMRHGAGAATAPDPSLRKTSLVDDVAEAAFGEADDLPEELRERLLNEGYVRIDTAGLFRSDRFVLPEQIARVHDNHVHLNVLRDDLLKKHAD